MAAWMSDDVHFPPPVNGLIVYKESVKNDEH